MNTISVNYGENTQSLRPVDPLSLFPIDGDGRDALVQNLICSNRQTFIPVYIRNSSNEDHTLEFIPVSDLGFNNKHAQISPYKFDVYLVSRIDNAPVQKVYILTMDCIGDISWLNEHSIDYKTITQIKYHFDDNMVIYSERYFTLSDDDNEYLIKNFPEKYILINLINYFLINTITSSYNIAGYSSSDFYDLNQLDHVIINKDYRRIINILLSKDIDNEYYMKTRKDNPNPNELRMTSDYIGSATTVSFVMDKWTDHMLSDSDVNNALFDHRDNFINIEKTTDLKQVTKNDADEYSSNNPF